MRILNLQEGETIELKREWTDRALEDLAAFANTHGGILLLAQAFYCAGHIERWGTGTARILTLCREQGLPEPDFDAGSHYFCVRFLKDPYTPERLRRMGLNERQIQAVLHLKVYGKVTNSTYQSLTGTTKRTASRDLEALVRMGLLEQIGETGKGTHYILKGTQRGQTRHKGDIKETKTP
jgi:ATP-dependent DNA helicase RecG